MIAPLNPDLSTVRRAEEAAFPRLPKELPPLLGPVGGKTTAPAAQGPPTFLRLSAGFVYFYFGFLKLFPDLSPAEVIAGETLTRLSFHWLSASMALRCLALMECAIGLCFLFSYKLHIVFLVFIFHQASTFLPLFIVPELCFKFAPFAPTMEGQYIFKNLISVAAGFTIMLPAVRAQLAAKTAARQQLELAGGVR